MTTHTVDILIITAADGEDDAVRAVDDGASGEWAEVPLDGHQFTVWQRSYKDAQGRPLIVALARAGQMGGEAATHAATALIKLLQPRCLAMCGVCAGRPGWTQLGDVIVADRVYRYDAGEEVVINGVRTFKSDVTTYNLHAGWKQKAERFPIAPTAPWLSARPQMADEQERWVLGELADGRDPLAAAERKSQCPDWSEVLDNLLQRGALFANQLTLTDVGRSEILARRLKHPDGVPAQGVPKIHVGPLGTGNKLVRDEGIFDRLSAGQRLIRGLDMEASAMGLVGHFEDVEYTIVVKGIMDFAEPGRNYRYRLFAARAAAEVLLKFLRDNLPAKCVDTETLLRWHAASWKALLSTPVNAKPGEQPSLRQRQLRDLRLDRYVWPGLAWEDTTHPDGHGQTKRMPLPGRDREPACEMLKTLLGGSNVVLYDDAGMGKTAFTYKLIELLIDCAGDLPAMQGQLPLVARLEGGWSHDLDGAPYSMAAFLGSVLSGSLEQQPRTVDDSTITAAVRDALRVGRVVILVDAFDQMSESDREHLARLLRGKATNPQDNDHAAQCKWLITGRPYALRKYQKELEALGAKRLRLTGLSPKQQDRYFEDNEADPFFRQRRLKPLDWMCADRKSIQEDLAIPFHLREIRRLIEVDLAHGGELRRIRSTGELHGLVARALLQRAVEQYALAAVPAGADRPDDNYEQLHLLLKVCGLLAFQLMLEQRYNASVDNHEDDGAVQAFLMRARQRFLAAEQSPARWQWAVWMLEKIEFSHRGDIDAFNPQCRSFRDRKTMEWYAAYYLMSQATRADLYERIPGAGGQFARDFAFDGEWLGNCWRQAIDMPRDLVKEAVVVRSLGLLFERPADTEKEMRRPCEHMWRVWERWLEPTSASRDSKAKPPRGAAELIVKFRVEFTSLCGEGNQIALSLRFDESRDRPDKKLGNKTPHGQYRSIPPDRSVTKFQGDRPSPVKVSRFWLRKFVVTNAEYRLFDPRHESARSGAFNEPDHPVIEVDWYMALMFCRWLGREFSLPTEAQWEAACRANESSNQEAEYWFGDEGKLLAKHAWLTSNSGQRTHSLAESVQAGGHENPWGLYDMHGNVWEWCHDWYGNYERTEADPMGPATGVNRVFRGGGWFNSAVCCRSSYRGGLGPSDRFEFLGFRVARSPSGQ